MLLNQYPMVSQVLIECGEYSKAEEILNEGMIGGYRLHATLIDLHLHSGDGDLQKASDVFKHAHSIDIIPDYNIYVSFAQHCIKHDQGSLRLLNEVLYDMVFHKDGELRFIDKPMFVYRKAAGKKTELSEIFMTDLFASGIDSFTRSFKVLLGIEELGIRTENVGSICQHLDTLESSKELHSLTKLLGAVWLFGDTKSLLEAIRYFKNNYEAAYLRSLKDVASSSIPQKNHGNKSILVDFASYPKNSFYISIWIRLLDELFFMTIKEQKHLVKQYAISFDTLLNEYFSSYSIASYRYFVKSMI